jgi:hypothetical protein
MFSVHSHYDIPFEDNLKIMHRHGAKIMYVYMYLPISLINDDLISAINATFGFDLQFEDDLAKFGLGDSSFIYTHSRANWSKYLTHTKIVDTIHNCMVTVEFDRGWGPLHRLKFVATPFYDGILYRTLPYYEELNKLVVIPNMFKFIHGVEKKLGDSILIVPRNFYDKAVSYISRQAEDAFSYTAFQGYVTAINNDVKYDGNLIWQGWHPQNPEYYIHTCISIFCIGAIMRHDRTQAISKFFKEIKIQNSSYVYSRITRFLSGRVDDILSIFSLDKDSR